MLLEALYRKVHSGSAKRKYASRKQKLKEPFQKITKGFLVSFLTCRKTLILLLSAISVRMACAKLKRNSMADVEIRSESSNVKGVTYWTEN